MLAGGLDISDCCGRGVKTEGSMRPGGGAAAARAWSAIVRPSWCGMSKRGMGGLGPPPNFPRSSMSRWYFNAAGSVTLESIRGGPNCCVSLSLFMRLPSLYVHAYDKGVARKKGQVKQEPTVL